MATAVAKKKNAELSTDFVSDMFEDGAEGAVFDADELQIPFLKIAQQMSPELKKSDAKFISGLSAGDFFNTLTSQVYEGQEGVDVIPCMIKTTYKEWIPLEKGGGFVQEFDATDPEIKQAVRKEIGGKRVDELPNGNELVISDDVYCLVVNVGDFEPALITMTSTQRKVAKRWKTRIAMNKERNPKTNKLQVVPIYSTIWKLTTVDETNRNNQTYSNYAVNKVRAIGSEDADLFQEAKSFRKSIVLGQVKVQQENANPNNETDPVADNEIPF